MIASFVTAAVMLLSGGHAPSYAAQMRTDPVSSSMSASQRVIWAKASLQDLGDPLTAANVRTMVDWFASEGTPHDLNNPLNLQTSYDHSYTSTADGDPAWVHIQAYRHPQDFLHAFGREMRHDGPDGGGSYAYILNALKSGHGLIGNRTRGVERDLSEYSGGGYDTIPAGYCPC